MRSVTISVSLAPGYSLGEALDYLDNLVSTSLSPEAKFFMQDNLANLEIHLLL